MADDKPEPPVRVVDRRWWARNEAASETGDAGLRKPTFVESLEHQLAEKTAQLQSLVGDHRRSLEEFEQIKVRIRRDVGREVERARRAIFSELLEVLDNLDRAVAAAREGAPATPAADDTFDRLARGVGLVRDQFLAKLQGFGVTRIEALGRKFDAARHDAVTTAPVDNQADDGTVVAVVKEGYAIGDEILRPASVVVGKAAD